MEVYRAVLRLSLRSSLIASASTDGDFCRSRPILVARFTFPPTVGKYSGLRLLMSDEIREPNTDFGSCLTFLYRASVSAFSTLVNFRRWLSSNSANSRASALCLAYFFEVRGKLILILARREVWTSNLRLQIWIPDSYSAVLRHRKWVIRYSKNLLKSTRRTFFAFFPRPGSVMSTHSLPKS